MVGGHLFPSPTFLNVLAFLALDPERAFYQRELTRLAGCNLLQCQRALQRLERAELVESRRDGNRVYYQICRNHPAFEDLKAILWKTIAVGDHVRALLSSQTDGIRLAFLFGSVAAGTESSASDIDLFIVGSLSPAEVSGRLFEIGASLRREFNPVVFTPEEFLEKLWSGNRFLEEVASSPKIWLVGNDGELGKMVGRGEGPPTPDNQE